MSHPVRSSSPLRGRAGAPGAPRVSCLPLGPASLMPVERRQALSFGCRRKARCRKMKRFSSSVALLLVALGVLAGTDAPASLASSTHPAARSVLTCAGKTAVRPANYVLACADANAYFSAIHWTSWTSRSATATATFVQNNCTPTCAAGKFVKYPARLVLSQPKSTKLGVLFSVVRYSYRVSASSTLPLTKLSSVH
jgi:hypothetical protein